MKTIHILLITLLISSTMAFTEDSAPLPLFEKGTIKALDTIPIQKGGRVKPLKTYASFLLLRINGVRKVRIENSPTLDPTTWFAQTLFYPEQAKKLSIFLVDNSDILKEIGAKIKKQRDRYSYEELEPFIENLRSRAHEIDRKKSDDRSEEETQLYQLANNVFEYQSILQGLDFARKKQFATKLPLTLNGLPLDNLLSIEKVADAFKNAPEFSALDDQRKEEIMNELSLLHRDNYILFDAAKWMTIFPPLLSEKEEWFNPKDLMLLQHDEFAKWQTTFQNLSIALEKTSNLKPDHADVNSAIISFTNALLENVSKVKNYTDIHFKNNLELKYYNWDLIYIALILLVIAFLSTSLQLTGKNKIWNTSNNFIVSLATILTIVAITMRCIILARPPVATLYETIIFITSGILLLSLVIEFLFKNRIGLFVGATLGSIGLFLSYKYELSEGTDTMGNLVAVLNSNFWLATHVTTINIGYLAGLLAAGLSHVWLVMKVFKINEDKEFFKDFNKIIYGVLCFCIIFSIVGTILGGVWANDSWGRFWGWDPKENGALAIVLWVLIILHARLGGIFKEFGINIMSIILGIVVTASWWGVNQLGVGLHSYGFTNGIVRNLLIFWSIELIFIAIVSVAFYSNKKALNQN